MNELINIVNGLDATVFYSAIVALSFIIASLTFLLWRSETKDLESVEETPVEGSVVPIEGTARPLPESIQYLMAHHDPESPYKIRAQNFKLSFDTLLTIEYEDYVEVQLDYCRKRDAPYGGRIYKGNDILFKIVCFDDYENECLHNWICSLPEAAEILNKGVFDGHKLDFELNARREKLRNKYL